MPATPWRYQTQAEQDAERQRQQQAGSQFDQIIASHFQAAGVDPSAVLSSFRPQQQTAAPQADYSNLKGLHIPGIGGTPLFQGPPGQLPESGGGFFDKLKDAASDVGSVLQDNSPQGMLANLRHPTASLANLRDVGQDAGGLALRGLDAASQYVGKPAFGIAGSVLSEPIDPVTGRRKHSNILEQLSDPKAFIAGVGEGLAHPQRAADAMDQRSEDYSGLGDIAYSTAAQPLNYVGPGIVGAGLKALPEGVAGARATRIVAGLLDQGGGRAVVGGALGSAGASELAQRAGLPEWAQVGAGIAGGVAGGVGGALANPEAIARSLKTGTLSGERGSFDMGAFGQDKNRIRSTVNGETKYIVGGKEVDKATYDAAGLHEPAPLGGPGAVTSPAPAATGSIEETILGVPKPTATPLTRTDVVLNRVKEALGMPQSNEVAKTAVDYRKQMLPVVESQANNLSTQVDHVVQRAFQIGADGRVENVPGRPFVQDIAARLPEFRAVLTPEQVAAMEQVQAQLAPFKAVLDRAGIAPASRADVIEGGFYMPRGRAAEEGADAAVKVGSGRGGGKAGFEKSAKFDSMAQGADAGYEYAPLSEAINSYAKDAGQRAVDTHVADYFKQARDEAGKLIGETPADRMDQVIKGQWEDVNNRLLSVRERLATAEKRAGVATGKGDELATVLEKQATGASIPLDASAAVERDINRFITRAQQRITALRQKGGAYAEQADNLERDLAAVKDERAALAPDYKAALEEARATPRTQGTIALPRSAALNGWTFPDAVATAMQEAINKERPLMGRGSTPTKAIQAYNTLTRGLRATGDVSFTAIQGLIGAARDPVGYGKAMAVAFKSMADSRALGAYFNDYDAAARAAGKMTIAEKARYGLHIGGADTEFSIKTGLSKAVDKLATGGRFNPIRGANRSFGYFGDVMRNELSDVALENASRHGFNLTDEANLRSAMDVANRATGWSRNTFGGDLGQLAMFAPRFFQSQLEYLATAAQAGTVGGMEARRGLVRLLGLSVGMTVLANEASDRLGGDRIGYDELFNPQSPNFMRFRVKGQDVSILGPWDSLARAAVSLSPLDMDRDLATMSGIKGNLKAPDPSYFLRTKASPAVAMAWDLLSGKTFTGEDARTPGNIVTQLVMPFALQDVANQNPLQTAVGATGLKSSPMSPTENLNALTRAQYGKDYGDLLATQQQEVQQSHPDVYQRYIEHGSSQRQQYEKMRQDYVTQQQAADAQLFSGQLDPRTWKAQVDDRRTRLQGAAEALYGNKPVTNPRDALQRYTQIIQQNQDPGTKAINWDAVDMAVSQLSASDQAEIADKHTVGSTPLVALQKQLAKSYFDLPVYRGFTADEARQVDQLVAFGRSRVPNAAAMTAAGLQVPRAAIYGALSQANPAELARLLGGAPSDRVMAGVRRSLYGLLTPDRSRLDFKKANPEVALVTAQTTLTPEQVQAVQARLSRQSGVRPGNIDTASLPAVRNPDGSVSTVRTISIQVDGREVLIPTVIDGKVVSNEEAIKAYRATGRNFGSFADVASANAYAEQLHQAEARRIGGSP